MAGQITVVNGFTGTTGYFLTGATSFSVTYTGVVGLRYRLRTGANGGGSAYTGGAASVMNSSPVTRGNITAPLPAAGATQNIYLQEEATLNSGVWADTGTPGTITNVTPPVLNDSQTINSTTQTQTVAHTPALTTSGAGGTLQYAFTADTTYSSGATWGSTVTLTRGDTVYLWARRVDNASYADIAGPFTVPYVATNLAVGTVTVGATELTGGSTSDVSVAWTPQSGHTYRVLRNDSGSNVVVISLTSTSPQNLLFSESGDLPSEGAIASYFIQSRRTPASGGDGVWYDSTGTNVAWEILRIKEPTVADNQDYDVLSQTSTITHAIGLKTQGLGGTLEYNVTTNTTYPSTGWTTTNSWTLTRGSTYYLWARRSTDTADYDISSAQVIPPYAIYGLRVYSTNGSKIVFDTTSLPMNLITCKLLAGTEVTSQTLAAGATGANVYVDGMTTTNGASIFVVVRSPSSLNTTPPYTLTRAAGYFTIKNNLTTSATFYFFAGRYK